MDDVIITFAFDYIPQNKNCSLTISILDYHKILHRHIKRYL